MLTVYIVRHGQTDDNLAGIIQGQKDTPLNATGLAQADVVAETLKTIDFDLAFSSDSQRAYYTGVAIVKAQNKPELELVKQKELRERDMGIFSNTRGPITKHPSLETSKAFVDRALGWFTSTIIPLVNAEEDRTILVTSHGAYIVTLFRALLADCKYGGLAYKLAQGVEEPHHCGNTSIAILELHDDGAGVVKAFNDHRHVLRKDEAVLKATDLIA